MILGAAGITRAITGTASGQSTSQVPGTVTPAGGSTTATGTLTSTG